MTPKDLRIFCTALGFTAIVMGGGEGTADDAHRAMNLANLIEAFCKHALPELDATNDADLSWHIDKMIEDMKSGLRGKGETRMDKDRATLFSLYHRLVQRYQSYASDDMAADRVLELLDAEIDLKYTHCRPRSPTNE